MSVVELVSDLRYRARALFRRDRLERELDEELRDHIARETEKYVRGGMPRAEAERRARLAFGGVEQTKEASRDARGTVLVETTLQDLRYALRGLLAKPGFTTGVVLTIGLGIGANAAMFGIVDRLLYRSPAYLRDAEHTHRLYMRWNGVSEVRTVRNSSFPRFLDFRQLTRSFTDLAAFQTRPIAVGDGEDSRERPVTVASASYFRLFDAPPALGRYYSADEDSLPAGANVVVLGHAFWQTHYGGSKDVLGKTLRVDRVPCTIIGVAPDGFTGMSDQGVPALYMPITAYAFQLRGERYPAQYTWQWLEIAGRRRDDVSVDAANADLTQAFRRSWELALAAQGTNLPLASAKPTAFVGPVQFARGPLAGAESKTIVWIGGVAVVVLLIACANVANLLLSRAMKRRREIAIRLALGVSRGRLIRQLLTESLLLAGLGGVLGLLIGQFGGRVLRASFASDTDAPLTVITDGRTLVVALVATVAVAVLTGLVPAAQALRVDMQRGLSAGGRDAGARRSRARTALLLFQATFSVVLLVGAGLFIRSFQNVRAMPLGYDVEPLLVAGLQSRGVRQAPAEDIALEERLAGIARATPGVVGATRAATIPFWSNEGRALFTPGVDSIGKLGTFILQAGDPDFFRIVGNRVIRGRGFAPSDNENAPRVMLVSDAMAKVIWPNEDAIGKCVRISADTAPCTTVVGIAEEMKARSLVDERNYTYYLPIAQYGLATGQLFIRVAGDAGEYADVLRRQLQPAMPGASYVTVVPLRKMVDPRMRSWRFGATMFLAFGGLALALAGIGLYSLIAYGVAQRQQEIGVRIALGASRGSVVRMVVGSGLRLVLLGVVLGSAIAWYAGRWIAALLYNETPTDPAVFGAVWVTLIGVALVATAVPALGASRVDPSVALRTD